LEIDLVNVLIDNPLVGASHIQNGLLDSFYFSLAPIATKSIEILHMHRRVILGGAVGRRCTTSGV
jgi:hypothetical protein